jgi:hypothetical protein
MKNQGLGGAFPKMGPNIKLFLILPLVVFAWGAIGDAGAQVTSSVRADIRGAGPSATPVCEKADVNAQVRQALRLVCAQTVSNVGFTSAQRLIVVGFLGGFAKDGDTKHPEVWFGDYLRERYSPATQVSVLSNHQRRRAVGDVLRELDTDHDGLLSASEREQARIIVYGHSWGASEATAFARELEQHEIPVLLTVQIDIVPKPGQTPILIPPNVEAAINFFQSEGFLHGRSKVVAEDPRRTEILGNLHMNYEDQHVDCRNYPWFARTFNKPHHKIENDARVWSQIALIIDARLSSVGNAINQDATR